MKTSLVKPARARPPAVVVIVALVLIQTYRVAALGVAQDALAASGSQAWFFPGLADFAFGITAPFMGLVLFQLTGLGVWVGGLVWLSLSLFDFVDGFATNLAVGPPPGIGASASDAAVVLLVWIAVDVVALALLSQSVVRRYYLQPGTVPGAN
jgi:hypothetical protein